MPLRFFDEDYQLYTKYGHEAVKLDKAGVQAEIKSPIFHGGAWSKKRSGTVHPGKLVRGLKQAAIGLGNILRENALGIVDAMHHRSRHDSGRSTAGAVGDTMRFNQHDAATRVLFFGLDRSPQPTKSAADDE